MNMCMAGVNFTLCCHSVINLMYVCDLAMNCERIVLSVLASMVSIVMDVNLFVLVVVNLYRWVNPS